MKQRPPLPRWSDDPIIVCIFEEIEQERHRYLGREVNLG